MHDKCVGYITEITEYLYRHRYTLVFTLQKWEKNLICIFSPCMLQKEQKTMIKSTRNKNNNKMIMASNLKYFYVFKL